MIVVSELLAALEGGRPALAVLDVHEHEPPAEDDPLRHHPRVLLTPYLAGLTAQEQERTSRLVVSDVLRVPDGGAAISAV